MDDLSPEKLFQSCQIDEEFLTRLAHNEKMAELGHLAAGMVHEVNTPLSVIVSAAQMILREREVPPFVREMVERIDLEAQRLSEIARGVLSFSRTGERSDEEADVNQVLREVMAFLRYEARKRSITVIEEFDYGLLNVAADRNRLKQIFINLVMNAFQAMERGGALHLRTIVPDNRTVVIEIADTGEGIPPERIDRIFEPFFTTKKAGEGTGLGLFVVRKMVELMHGRIDVASTVGMGTTFSITLSQV